MTVVHNPEDYVVVTYLGTVLAHKSERDGHVVYDLPRNEKPRNDADLAASVRNYVDTLAEVGPPLTIDGRRYAVITIAPRLLPRLAPGDVWLSPEDVQAGHWVHDVLPLIEPLAQRLLDGVPVANATCDAVRIGRTVRKATGPWTPAVHAALEHLEEFGLDAVPAVRGFDARGREILSYMPGQQIAQPGQFLNDIQLSEVTSWALRLSEAWRGFRHPGPFRGAVPGEPTVMGHNDLSPTNLCFAGNQLVGVLNWDLTGPTTLALEVAWMAWSTVPLAGAGLSVAERAHRLAIISSAYDMDVDVILDAVPERIALRKRSILEGAERDDVLFKDLLGAAELDALEQSLHEFHDDEEQLRIAVRRRLAQL